MSYKPGDFFVGIIDLFAILLPGAMLAYLWAGFYEARVAGVLLPRAGGGAKGWAVFVVASYVLGHFIFILGAVAEEGFDPAKKIRWLRKRMKVDITKDCAEGLMNGRDEVKAALPPDEGQQKRLINRLIKTAVRAQHAEAQAEVDRLDAVSKFFRSFAVVIVIFGVTVARWWYSGSIRLPSGPYAPALIVVLIGTLVISYMLYAFQDARRESYIYSFFIELELSRRAARTGDASAGSGKKRPPAAPPRDPTDGDKPEDDKHQAGDDD